MLYEMKTTHVPTILIVDDEEILLRTSKQMLESAGYHVLTAINGLDALKRFVYHADIIDLMVTDINMPVMDGLALATTVKYRYPDTPIIFTSGSIDLYQEEAEVRLLDFPFLPKPYRFNDLISLIETQIQVEDRPAVVCGGRAVNFNS